MFYNTQLKEYLWNIRVNSLNDNCYVALNNLLQFSNCACVDELIAELMAQYAAFSKVLAPELVAQELHSGDYNLVFSYADCYLVKLLVEAVQADMLSAVTGGRWSAGDSYYLTVRQNYLSNVLSVLPAGVLYEAGLQLMALLKPQIYVDVHPKHMVLEYTAK